MVLTPQDLDSLAPAELVGQLLVVGFDGQRAPPELAQALRAGERAGVILFRRNLEPGLGGLGKLQDSCAELGELAKSGLPPLISIDEEGGRVARLSPPALVLPPMRRIASLGDLELMERVGRVMGNQLRCLGLTMNFAPVVDVDTNPHNPVIGDRAFSRDPAEVASFAGAYLRGLQASGLLGCLKHYPGHGDTLEDSHHALPTVRHDRARLEAVELLPFRRLAPRADSMMTAHVVYPCLDPECAATLSSFISETLLRAELGFEGVLFSDDLEMQAIAGHAEPEQSAVQALEAGCDMLLVCSDARVQARVHAALLARFTRSEAFAGRCRQAAGRSLAMRRRCPPRPGSLEDFGALLRSEVMPLQAELERRLGSAS